MEETPPGRERYESPPGDIRIDRAANETHARLTPHGPVIWAVDVFCDEADYEVQLKTGETLRRTFPDHDIHPVYVLSEDSFADRGFSNFLRPALKPLAYKSLISIVRDAKVDAVKPRILVEPSGSRATWARKFLRYARRLGATAIGVASTQRPGLSRFLTGSFSDTVLAEHELPVMLVGPESVSLKSPPRVIVVPTDFSPESHEAFQEIVSLAASLGAELHLFHKAIHDLDPLVQSGVHMLGGGWVSIESYLGFARDDRAIESKLWLDDAARLGVQARFIAENFREPTSDAIVQYVKQLSGASPLVAMVSHVGRVAGRILGSVTRDVVRACPAPVYVASRPL